jgi:hypothetical protein
MSEDFVSYVDAVDIVRRPHETDEQASKRLLVAYRSGKVRHRYDAERAAAKLDDVRAEINAMIGAQINALAARHKVPGMSDVEFEEGVRKEALDALLLVRFTEIERGSLLRWSGSFGERKLKNAPDALIRDIARAVYHDCPANGGPSYRDLPQYVLPRLKERGFVASSRAIQKIGQEAEFEPFRRKAGRTRTSEAG